MAKQAAEGMDSDSWCSPRKEIAIPLEQFFHGPVGIDPCSNVNSVINSEVAYTFGGLHLPWRGRKLDTGYMNNPYSSNQPWANKAVREMNENLDELVTLMMVATSTAWWGTMCLKAARNPRIVFTKRLPFIGDKDHGARFDTALKYYGRRHRAFEREFKHITRWTAWGR